MAPKPNIYARVNDRIIADSGVGIRPWHKPLSAEHLASRVTRSCVTTVPASLTYGGLDGVSYGDR